MLCKILKNEKGGIFIIAAAIVTTLITLLSSVTLMNLINSDNQITQYEHDIIQEEMLLRTELTRSSLAIEKDKFAPLPDRKGIEIFNSSRKRIFNIKSQKTRRRTGYSIQSFIEAESVGKSGRKIPLPIKRLTEKYINPKSLAEYQYITHTEESENADGGDEAARVKFYGDDQLYGPVHSNSDIWLQNNGSGNNNGWPIFYAKVTTTGRFRNYTDGGAFFDPGTLNDICVGGWEEEVPVIFLRVFYLKMN